MMRRVSRFLSVVLIGAMPLAALAGGGDPWPEKVLEGTDLFDVSSYPEAAIHGLDGQFRAETGGAKLLLDMRQLGDGWVVKRAYAEPGEPPIVQQWQVAPDAAEPSGAYLSDAGGTLVLRATEGGVIAWESGQGAPVPDGFWVFYAKE